MKVSATPGMALGAGVIARPELEEDSAAPRFHYHIECVGPTAR
jgi:hypothetical protein